MQSYVSLKQTHKNSFKYIALKLGTHDYVKNRCSLHIFHVPLINLQSYAPFCIFALLGGIQYISVIFSCLSSEVNSVSSFPKKTLYWICSLVLYCYDEEKKKRKNIEHINFHKVLSFSS